MTYDEFYKHFEEHRAKRRKTARNLSKAIQKRAGLDIDTNTITEKAILDKFKNLFKTEVLIDSMSADIKEEKKPVVEVKTPSPTAATTQKPVDEVLNDLFEDASDGEDDDNDKSDTQPTVTDNETDTQSKSTSNDVEEDIDNDLVDLVEATRPIVTGKQIGIAHV